MQNKRILARIAKKKKNHHKNKIKEIRTFHAKDYSSIVDLQLMRKIQGQGEYSCSKCDVELSYTDLDLNCINKYFSFYEYYTQTLRNVLIITDFIVVTTHN